MAGVTSGLDVLVRERADLIRGRRVGIICTEGAIDRHFRHVLPLVQGVPGAEIVRLVAPEHGIRGAHVDGAPIADGTDPLTGLPVHSIYGPRSWLAEEALADLDVVLFDIPDVGARYYTRAATMIYCLRAA